MRQRRQEAAAAPRPVPGRNPADLRQRAKLGIGQHRQSLARAPPQLRQQRLPVPRVASAGHRLPVRPGRCLGGEALNAPRDARDEISLRSGVTSSAVRSIWPAGGTPAIDAVAEPDRGPRLVDDIVAVLPGPSAPDSRRGVHSIFEPASRVRILSGWPEFSCPAAPRRRVAARGPADRARRRAPVAGKVLDLHERQHVERETRRQRADREAGKAEPNCRDAVVAGGDLEQRHARTARAAVDPADVGAMPDAVARPVVEIDRHGNVRRELGKRTGEFKAEAERQLGCRFAEERPLEAEFERNGRGIEADGAAAVRPHAGFLSRRMAVIFSIVGAAQPDIRRRREDQLRLVGRPRPSSRPAAPARSAGNRSAGQRRPRAGCAGLGCTPSKAANALRCASPTKPMR